MPLGRAAPGSWRGRGHVVRLEWDSEEVEQGRRVREHTQLVSMCFVSNLFTEVYGLLCAHESIPLLGSPEKGLKAFSLETLVCYWSVWRAKRREMFCEGGMSGRRSEVDRPESIIVRLWKGEVTERGVRLWEMLLRGCWGDLDCGDEGAGHGRRRVR